VLNARISYANTPLEAGPAEWFRDVLAIERDTLSRFLVDCPAVVAEIVTLIAAEERPIVCTGVGKSGLVAAKLAATFSSLGTPAFFLNAAEASHGDLGAVQTGNVVILLSNSGATEEITRILPLLQARGCRLVGIIGRPDSPLARAVDYLIPAGVEREADHIGMAPTASTTLHIAIGDALAVAVSRARGFDKADFLRHHPAGLLGRHMIPVRSLMRCGDDVPVVLPHASIAEALPVISAKRLGATCVTDWRGQLVGLLTDGDVRRLIEARGDLYATPVSSIMRTDPRVIAGDALFADVIELLQGADRRFTILPVVSADGRLEGVLQTYDLMQS
jgi:arabinose-5-phosphate isomerase